MDQWYGPPAARASQTTVVVTPGELATARRIRYRIRLFRLRLRVPLGQQPQAQASSIHCPITVLREIQVVNFSALAAWAAPSTQLVPRIQLLVNFLSPASRAERKTL